jgi:hypothetical protein
MPQATAAMANKTQKPSQPRKSATEGASLDHRYGQIGISAVAAAARYQGGAKNPAYAPSQNNAPDRAGEAAA